MQDIEERIRLHFGLVPEVKDETQPIEPGTAPAKEGTSKSRRRGGRSTIQN